MHRHACGYGHYWDCDGTAIRYSEELIVCICLDHGVSMEDGDHSQCTIELLNCPRHPTGQAHSAQSSLPAKDQIEQSWVSIQIPDNLEEMLQNWNNDPGPNIGWCLICNSAIRTEDDLVPGTNLHNCVESGALEANLREKGGFDQRPEFRRPHCNSAE